MAERTRTKCEDVKSMSGFMENDQLWFNVMPSVGRMAKRAFNWMASAQKAACNQRVARYYQ